MSVIRVPNKLVNSFTLGANTNVEPTEKSVVDKDAIKALFKDELDELFQSAQDEGLALGMKAANELVQEELLESKEKLSNEFNKKHQNLTEEYTSKIQNITNILKAFEIAHEKLESRVNEYEKEQEFNVIQLTMECLFKISGEQQFLEQLLKSSIKAELDKIDTSFTKLISVSPDTYLLIKDMDTLKNMDHILKQNIELTNSQFTVEYDHVLHTVDLMKRIESSCKTLVKCYEERNL